MTNSIEFDLAAYVSPGMELIYENASDAFRGHWPRVEEYLTLVRPNRQIGDRHNAHLAIRQFGSSSPVAFAQDRRSIDHPYPYGMLHDEPAARGRLLADQGIATQVLHPGPTLLNVRHLPMDLGVNILEGYNRYVHAYARSVPERLRYTIQLHAHAPDWSRRELDKYAGELGMAGATICFPAAVPVDAPELDPVWEILNRRSIALFHRQAITTSIWTPRRFLYIMATERICERYPEIPLVFIESGSHWLHSLCRQRGSGAAEADCRDDEPILQELRKISNRITVSLSETDTTDAPAMDDVFQNGSYGFETRMPFEIYTEH